MGQVVFTHPSKKVTLILGIEPVHGFKKFLSEKVFIMTDTPEDNDLMFQHGDDFYAMYYCKNGFLIILVFHGNFYLTPAS